MISNNVGLSGLPHHPTLKCLLEIFTFLRMGGSVERIEVLFIADPRKDPAQAQAELTATFENFDAAKAECFLPKDRERLLAVIEAGFGDVREFNKIVRRIFAGRQTSQAV